MRRPWHCCAKSRATTHKCDAPGIGTPGSFTSVFVRTRYRLTHVQRRSIWLVNCPFVVKIGSASSLPHILQTNAFTNIFGLMVHKLSLIHICLGTQTPCDVMNKKLVIGLPAYLKKFYVAEYGGEQVEKAGKVETVIRVEKSSELGKLIHLVALPILTTQCLSLIHI